MSHIQESQTESPTGSEDAETGESSRLPPAAPPGDEAGHPMSKGLVDEAKRLDYALVFLVLVLAAFLSAFPVRNSDFWMHLATGRSILSGQSTFGVDPYSYTTAGAYWANTSWLYDSVFYGLVRMSGGGDTALAGYLVVGLKSLLMVALALVMMMTRRRGESLWAPAFCTLLALLAMSPRFILQPLLVSALFLAVTLYLLQMPRREDPRHGPAGKSRAYWLLPLLFVLWVNLDEWFLLGPATVALYLIGQLLQQVFAPIRTGEDAPETGLIGKLALVLIIGTAACLINPYHFHAFVIPSQLSPNLPREMIGADNYLRSFLISIFDLHMFGLSAGTASMIATYALIILGIVSFIVTFGQGWRWPRLVIWGAFFFLGAYQARLIILFAVVAAPLTALNLQDFFLAQFKSAANPAPIWKVGSIVGRLASCLLCLALILLTWPGWLHGIMQDGRRQHQVGLKLEPDESVASAARSLAEWQKSGMIAADAHVFNWVPDLPAYFAWYQPDSEILKGFLDYRFSLFPKSVFSDYLEIRQALHDSGERRVTSTTLLDLFRKHKIQYLALNWAEPFTQQLLMAMREWNQWKVLHMEGTTVVVQLVNPANRPAASLPPRINPNRMAFDSHTIMAPEAGPGRDPRTQEWLQTYLDGSPVRPPQTLSAFQFLAYFESIRSQWPQAYVAATNPVSWGGLAAASACAPMVATGAAPLNLVSSTLFSMAVFAGQLTFETFAPDTESGPPGALLLAIRYARQGILADPDQYQAYSHLATGYDYISKSQEDRWSFNPILEFLRRQGQQAPSPRQALRRTQLITALEQVLKVRPDDPIAHRMLGDIYEDLKYLDLANEHRRALAIRIASMGPNGEETQEAYGKRIEAMQKLLQQNDEELNRRRNAFEVAAQNKPLLEKAQEAVRHGLGKHALELMMEADSSAFGPNEIKFELELMLTQGRADDLEQAIKEDFRHFLGMTYDWFKAQAGASLGNYDEAYKALENAADQIETMAIESALQLSVSQTMSGDSNLNAGKQRAVADLQRQYAEFISLAGIIALERGDIKLARSNFDKALALGDKSTFFFESKPIVKQYLRLLDNAAAGH